MLSPAFTVVTSLLLVAAIGYLIGSATGRRSASRARIPLQRRLQTERDELGGKLGKAEAQRDELRAKLSTAEADRDALRKRLQDGGSGDADTTDAQEHAARELQRRDEKLAEIQARLQTDRDELEALRSENSALEHRLADRQTALEITTSDREVHAGRLQEVTRELETLRRRVADQPGHDDEYDDTDVRALESDLDRLRAQLNSQGGQLREALQTLAERDEALTHTRAKLEATRARQSPEGDAPPATAELEANVYAISEVEDELEQVREALAASEAARAELANERDAHAHRVTSAEDQVSGNVERVARLQQEAEDLEQRYGQQVQELAEVVQQLRRRLEDRNEEIQRLRDERQRSSERIDRHGEVLRTATAQIDSLRAERDELAAGLAALKEDSAERDKALQGARDEAKALKSDYVVQIRAP